MNLQHLRRRHVERALHRAREAMAAQKYSECMHAQAALDDEWDYWDGDEERNRTCRHCDGTGRDQWNDGITPCEHCDGEGYE